MDRRFARIAGRRLRVAPRRRCGCCSDFCAHGRSGPDPVDAVGRAAPQKPKSKAPVIIAVACAAVVLLGGGTVFALTMLNGSKSSDTQISVIDTGSSDEKDSSAKKKSDKSKAKESFVVG